MQQMLGSIKETSKRPSKQIAFDIRSAEMRSPVMGAVVSTELPGEAGSVEPVDLRLRERAVAATFNAPMLLPLLFFFF